MNKTLLTLIGVVAVGAVAYQMYMQSKRDKVFANMGGGFDVAGRRLK
jgi:hypothetical protein